MKRLFSILLFLPLFAVAQTTSPAFYGAYYTPASVAPAYDTGAQNYFTAEAAEGNIISDPHKTAINDFYVGLKTDGIYNDIIGMWITKWGNANYNKYNLVDPQNSDAAHRQTYNGSPTHGSTGITTNFANVYINLHLNDNILNQNSFSFGEWITSVATNGAYMGVTDYGSSTCQLIKISDINSRYAAHSVQSSSVGVQPPGFLLVTRTSSTTVRISLNGANTNTQTLTSNTPINADFLVGSLGDGTTGYKSGATHTTPFQIIINKGLTTTEVTNLYNRVNTLLSLLDIWGFIILMPILRRKRTTKIIDLTPKRKAA